MWSAFDAPLWVATYDPLAATRDGSFLHYLNEINADGGVEEKRGMAYGFNFGITLDGCTRFLAQASSDHCTAIRVKSDPAFWTLREASGVVKQVFFRGSESRVASVVVASAGDEQAGDDRCELVLDSKIECLKKIFFRIFKATQLSRKK